MSAHVAKPTRTRFVRVFTVGTPAVAGFTTHSQQPESGTWHDHEQHDQASAHVAGSTRTRRRRRRRRFCRTTSSRRSQDTQDGGSHDRTLRWIGRFKMAASTARPQTMFLCPIWQPGGAPIQQGRRRTPGTLNLGACHVGGFPICGQNPRNFAGLRPCTATHVERWDEAGLTHNNIRTAITRRSRITPDTKCNGPI